MMTTVLDASLEARKEKVQIAKGYLERTKVLFDQFGSAELKTIQANFEKILDSLSSDAVRIVVLGEFTRGKSSLMNALLNIDLLPTALEATTAINTFIRALPANTAPFIRIHFQTGRSPADIEWSDDALKRWGTELDESHADVRQSIDYIEVFMDHPLLQKGLVLIDTPGLQAVMAHHRAITEKAIAQAHIALWVQNTTMLGGSASEWSFLQDTLKSNFQKFITVVGWWDLVLDPQDPQQRKKSEEVRCNQSMEIVRRNFRMHLKDSDEAEVLTDPDHLMGVSAWWAMSDEPEKRRRSGIDRLAQRIADMFSSGEALEQIYSGPLQKLATIQGQLATSLSDELQQLASDKTLEERQRELELFDQEIENLRLESDGVARDSREEHDRVSRALVEKVKRQLVEPLRDLKSEIESRVDEKHVERMIAKRVVNIGLPEDLHAEFQSIAAQVGTAWAAQKKELSLALEGLRADYAKQMEKHVRQLKSEMNGLDVEIPSLDINFSLDFSDIEQHHKKAMALEQEISARQEQIESLDEDMIKHAGNRAQFEMARQALTRSERMVEQMGGQPSAETRYKNKMVKEGGMYSDDEYRDVAYSDDSNVKAWQAERGSLMKELKDKEARLAQISAEEERKTGIRMSLEKAQKKYEREIADFEKKQALYERQARDAQASLVHETTQRLIKNTAGQLDQRIRYLENHVADAISQVFMDQLKALQACVEEQYLEPMKAKLEKREEIQTLLRQGIAQIEQRKALLGQAQKDVAELLAMTQNALHA